MGLYVYMYDAGLEGINRLLQAIHLVSQSFHHLLACKLLTD
jgi:hypothetical protein